MHFSLKSLVAALSLLALLGGCQAAAQNQGGLRDRLANRATNAEVPPGVQEAAITVNGQSRSFLYYVPASRSANPGVVLGLHGGRGSGATFLGQTPSMLSYADQLGFIAVYPNANGN